jgi:phosphotransferase system enzyme I (PtsP)
LRERLHDLDDLANRLMRELMGSDQFPRKEELPDNAILVARNMSPAALLDFDRSRLRGLVLEEGAATSHVAIVARALGVATVGQVENVASLADPGDPIIVDGDAGEVHLRPPPGIESAYQEKVRLRARRQAQYAALRDQPAVSKDGVGVQLLINAGLVVDLPHLKETGADGIGLFRTELQFMVAATLPRTGEQLQLYRTVLDAADGKPVTFRTLDIGGDKVLPYMRSLEEENPALGWRAIRVGLDRPALLRIQLRALLHAAAGRDLRLMFPMISAVEEFESARELVERELTHLRRHGHKLPEQVQIGAMVEVPALLFALDEILKRADFLSVGSNDLVQFMFAADRGNARVAGRFDALSPPVLRALKAIADAGKAHDKPITLCGELASRPLEAMALLALGFRTLSVSAAAIGPVKAMIMGLDVGQAQKMLAPVLAERDGRRTVREQLEAFAAEHGVPV